jgi:hypothetical protein
MPDYVKNLCVLHQGSKYGLYHKTMGNTKPVTGGLTPIFLFNSDERPFSGYPTNLIQQNQIITMIEC